MKISVGVITYCQQNTIRQTIESILCQKGDFELEIIIGEDHSPDDTRKICEGLALSNPSIKLLDDEPNLGIVGNFARVMNACSGDYVGICAGDDYWCDDRKLDKQQKFLCANPQYGVCSTSGYSLFVRKNKLVPGIAPIEPYQDGDVSKYYFDTNRFGGVYAMPLSLLIRSDVLDRVPFDEFVSRKFPVEDYPMQAIMSKITLWGHIPDKTVVYRVYSSSSTFISYDHPRYMSFFRGMVEIKRYLAEKFPDCGAYDGFGSEEFLFYKEFLMLLHKSKYKEAKSLVSNKRHELSSSLKFRQADKFTQTWFHFELFRMYKEVQHCKDLLHRT